ncbi:MAG: CpsD/CapB family tyrosine-protein kinase [Acidobacteriota bacterium]|nr:CpsD/CapB family tyrosine-protein kinase [Acidobacteriota bacterium]
MDYLYKTIQREMGITPTETHGADDSEPADGAVFPTPASSAPPASLTGAAPAPRGPSLRDLAIRKVEFPVKLERLFCISVEKMSREQRYALEQYRVLRSRVLELARDHRVRTLMVTSAVAGEHKTTTSINLALAISQVQGIRVCLVDADMRKSGIAPVLGIPFEAGLQDLLRGALPLHEAMLQLTDSLYLVPSGDTDLSSSDVLHSSAMSSMLHALREAFDIVIVDTPPLFPVADARILANLVDGALMCVRAGSTSSAAVEEAAELIRPKLLGTVLVDAAANSSPYYYYESKPGARE